MRSRPARESSATHSSSRTPRRDRPLRRTCGHLHGESRAPGEQVPGQRVAVDGSLEPDSPTAAVRRASLQMATTSVPDRALASAEGPPPVFFAAALTTPSITRRPGGTRDRALRPRREPEATPRVTWAGPGTPCRPRPRPGPGYVLGSARGSLPPIEIPHLSPPVDAEVLMAAAGSSDKPTGRRECWGSAPPREGSPWCRC